MLKQRNAAGSPSAAARVISGPAIPVRRPAAELQQARCGCGRPAGELARLGHERVAARVLLPASAIATPAHAAIGHDAVVARLAAHPPPAAIKLAANDDAAADPGADGEKDDVVLPAGRAKPGLGPDRRVGVVLHHDRNPKTILDGFLHRLVTPAKVRGEHDVARSSSTNPAMPRPTASTV